MSEMGIISEDTKIMATRQETQNKRRKMREAIIESRRSGKMQDGDLLPNIRDLARKYGLSVNLASEVVQSLVAEGVLHARPGAGTIVGNPRPTNPGTYLFLLPEGVTSDFVASSHIGVMQRNFEVAIAQLGGACLILDAGEARGYAAAGQLPLVAGIFATNAASFDGLAIAEVPRVCFGGPELLKKDSDAANFDVVHFDDKSGGGQATRHLLAAGHEKVAYLALHAPDELEKFAWSAEREQGWREAMTAAGHSCRGLAFHPAQTPALRLENKGTPLSGAEQIEAAREAAAPLSAMIRARKATAVVAANLFAARALFAVLEEDRIAPELWPAVVCFDGFDGLDNHVVSAVNLPWDEVGKAGAQLLWERNVGRLRGASEVRLVPMQLIPRLTCRPDWSESSSLLAPHIRASVMSRPSRAVPAVAS